MVLDNYKYDQICMMRVSIAHARSRSVKNDVHIMTRRKLLTGRNIKVGTHPGGQVPACELRQQI